MNRRMRTRMSGGVGSEGEKPSLTRLRPEVASSSVMSEKHSIIKDSQKVTCFSVSGILPERASGVISGCEASGTT